jgi:predicted O-methyltransferase YrrM
MTVLEAVGGSWRRSDDPGEPTTGEPRVSITGDEALLLSALAVGRDVLEIGTGLGVSTRALAETARWVVTVDVDPWVRKVIWPELPENVICATNAELDRTFDMVFIDGDHSTDAVRRDIDTAQRLAPCGLIVAHDAIYPHVRAAFDDRWRIIETEHGIGVRW